MIYLPGDEQEGDLSMWLVKRREFLAMAIDAEGSGWGKKRRYVCKFEGWAGPGGY